MTSDFAAKSIYVSTTSAPCSPSSLFVSGLLLEMTKSYPALIKFLLIGFPIIPNPIKLIFIFTVSLQKISLVPIIHKIQRFLTYQIIHITFLLLSTLAKTKIRPLDLDRGRMLHIQLKNQIPHQF